jgi:hypothetical protein
MIRLRINLRKLTDFRTFTGKDGVEYAAFPIKANSIYMTEKVASMDVTLMDNRNGKDDYENDGFAVLDLGKERRLAGDKGPILGNWRDLDGGNQRAGRDVSAAETTRRPPPLTTARDNGADDADDSEIPF